MPAEPLNLPIPGADPVSALWLAPPNPRACLVLAHGAGAGVTHRSMTAIAEGLADRAIATLDGEVLAELVDTAAAWMAAH